MFRNRSIIRAYQTESGAWLAGMTLDPAIVYEAWCHQRGYVCFIQEVGGLAVKAGGGFSSAYIVGFFEGVEEMENIYDAHKEAKRLVVTQNGFSLE